MVVKPVSGVTLFFLWFGAAAFASAQPALQVAAAASHVCALLADHTVKCWGNNDSGQLGLGDTQARGGTPNTMGANLPVVALGKGRSAVFIATGGAHSCAILDNGSVKCWGSGANGQLGLGDANNRGDQPNTMGDALPSVDLGKGRTAVSLALGGSSSCALLDDHTTKCWGVNGRGQLGLGDSNDRGSAPGQMGDALPAVNFGTGRLATALVTGSNTSCATLDNGALKCWGGNEDAQLGLADENDRGGMPGQMGDSLGALDLGGHHAVQAGVSDQSTCALIDDGTVRCWGSNLVGSRGDGQTVLVGGVAAPLWSQLQALDLAAGLQIRSLQCGPYHCCTLFINNALKCWGDNDAGALGLEDTITRGNMKGQMGAALAFVDLGPLAVVKTVSIGSGFSCALLKGGSIKCWGYNPSGQLGTEDAQNRGDTPGTMGAALRPVSL